MILVFLGSMRATVAVLLSIPLSALATFIALSLGGGFDQQHGAGRTGARFSRLIDNSVVVLENIFRHLEMGESPRVRPRKAGGKSPSRAGGHAHYRGGLLPGTFLYGVSRFLFSALALAVVFALFASYFVAMTVVPLFCARFLKAPHHGTPSRKPVEVDLPSSTILGDGSTSGSTTGSSRCSKATTAWLAARCAVPATVLGVFGDAVRGSLALFPLLGVVVLSHAPTPGSLSST